MRAYLFVLAAVVLGSMLSHVPSPAPIHADFVRHGSSEEMRRADDVPDAASSSATVVLERSADGHFYADVEVNAAKLHMLIDTGASEVALSRDDARAASIATSIGMNNVIGVGAGGNVYGEQVTIERISLGGKSVQNMPAIVLSDGSQSLLGQSFLEQFESVEIHGDRIILR
jgi:aspartyl protease family protein